MPPPRRCGLKRRAAAAVLATAAILCAVEAGFGSATPGQGAAGIGAFALQARADTLPAADTVPTPPDPLAHVRPPPPPAVPTFPGPVPPAEGGDGTAYECDRGCLLDTPWLTLAELVTEVAPGILPVRGAWFGGPHHVVHGLGGPGAVRLVLDGRELVPLESGQVDLLRIPLVQLDRVRIRRRADGLVVEALSRRQEGPRAYSRVLGATASPRGEALRGIFTNRWGRSFTVGAAIDLVDVPEEGRTNDRLDFRGQLGWASGSDRAGLELDYQSQTLVRTGADTADLGRRELFLRGRAELAEGVRAELLAGRTELRDQELEEAVRSVRELGLSLGARLGETELFGGVATYDGEGIPDLRARARAVTRLAPGLVLDAGGELSDWSDFTALQGRVGAEGDLRLGLPVTLRADAATGRRGVARPTLDTAESVSFDAVAAELRTVLGPYSLRGRAAWERVDEQHPFGTPFDAALAPRAGAEITSWEVGAAGPVLPLGWIVSGLGTITGEGFWRHQEPTGAVEPLYAPRDLLGGRLFFLEDFFDGNLEIRLGGSYLYRGRTLGAAAGAEELVELPAYSWFTGHFQFRIGHFRAFWKVLNPAGLTVQDVSGVDLPRQFNIFGIQWEFFD